MTTKDIGQPNQGPKPAGARRPSHDWEAIERDYRSGRFTLRELSALHGPNGPDAATIKRRADKHKWEKDLAEAVRIATRAKVIEATVAAEAAARATETQQAVAVAQQAVASSVSVASDIAAKVVIEHRARAKRAAEVARGILEELSAAAALDEDRELIAEILAGDGADPGKVAEARQAIQRALGIGARASTVQKLTDSLAKAQAMEERAYRLEDAPSAPQPAMDIASVPPDRAMEAYLTFVARKT